MKLNGTLAELAKIFKSMENGFVGSRLWERRRKRKLGVNAAFATLAKTANEGNFIESREESACGLASHYGNRANDIKLDLSSMSPIPGSNTCRCQPIEHFT